ncbi:MAG: hypothetical protein ABI183_23075, partial [Polyangiaceae bacterium]
MKIEAVAVTVAALSVSIALGNLSGCSSGNAAAPTFTSSAGGPVIANVTFHKDVEPILQKNCQKCHVSGGIAPFALMTYDDAKQTASEMATQTAQKTMPPWGAFSSSTCTPTHGFQEDLRLSDQDIQTIADWDSAGAPEGDPKDAPPAIAISTNVGLSGAVQAFKPAAPYKLTASSDQFRCYVLDPKLTSTQYMNGAFVIPGNTQIVHHALIFADPNQESLALITDKTNNSYDCFGGPGTSAPSLVSAWAPGMQPQEFPSNVGMAIQKGTLFVMQVHYHPHSTVTSDTDVTTFQIRYLDKAPAYNLLTQLIGNFDGPISSGPGDGLMPGPDDPPSGPAFLIPAGVSGHTEEMQLTIPTTISGVALPDLYLYGVASHEHYVGTQQAISISHTPGFLSATPGAPSEECLLNVPAWNFNWQRFYAYQYDGVIEHLPRVGPGDKLHIKCTYDNTMQNPLLAESLGERQMNAPVDVKLGETTLDEMCLGG